MPEKKFKGKMKRRGQYRRKKVLAPVMNSKIARIQRGPFNRWNSINPFPVNYNCKFVYAAEGVLTTSTTTNITGNYDGYRLNSPYDPWTGVAVTTQNTSCSGFSKLLSANGPYLRYKVHAVKIDLLIYNPSIDGVAVVAEIKGGGSSFDPSGKNIMYLERMPMTTVKRVNDSGSQKRRVVQYMPCSQLYGITKIQMAADNAGTTGPYNGLPQYDTQIRLCAACTDPSVSGTARTVQYKLVLTYYTQCYDRYEVTTAESPF